MKTTIESLRVAGNKIRVQHKRAYKGYSDLMTRGQFEDLKNTASTSGVYSTSVSPRGGETVVQITTPNGENLEGVAKCSLKDAYNRKKGLLIALGRALNGAPHA